MSNINLYEHQKRALKFIEKREKEGPLRGGILALKMGLGKTAIMLEYITREKSDNKTLIACSKTVLGEWITEHQKFFTNLKILIYHREFCRKEYNLLSIDMINQYDVVLTTYDVLLSIDRKSKYSENICVRGEEGIHKDKIIAFQQSLKCPEVPENNPYGPHILYCYPWKRFITDESQRIANSKTQTFRAITSLYSNYRWCLTGTPIRNGDKDMWSLLFFCGMETPNNPKNYKYSHFKDLKNIILVMDYKDANMKITDCTHHVEKINFNEAEYKIYKYYIKELWDAYDRFIRKQGEFAGDEGYALILGLFCRLRQICISPYLICDESKRNKEYKSTELANLDEKYLEQYAHNKQLSGYKSSKILKIKEIISNIPSSDKIIIFSSFSSCLDLIYDALKDKYQMIIVDGSITGKKRFRFLNEFRNNPKYRILLCNFRVGNEGLNLTIANHVICVELWWSPTLVNQAISRSWRIGQTKNVHSYKIIVDKSIEESIEKLCKAKESISNSYLYGNTSSRISKPRLDKHTLGKIIGYYDY